MKTEDLAEDSLGVDHVLEVIVLHQAVTNVSLGLCADLSDNLRLVAELEESPSEGLSSGVPTSNDKVEHDGKEVLTAETLVHEELQQVLSLRTDGTRCSAGSLSGETLVDDVEASLAEHLDRGAHLPASRRDHLECLPDRVEESPVDDSLRVVECDSELNLLLQVINLGRQASKVGAESHRGESVECEAEEDVGKVYSRSLALSIVGEAHENVEVVLDCLLDVGTEVADAEDVRCHLALLAPDLAVGGKDAVLAHCKE